jgi:glycosyltransferase involved in cell wall biosynthesis
MKPSKNPLLVSIITPVYNGAAYIEKLILSITSQNYPNIEHIIIDDGSQDEGATLAILQRYPHLRWWSRENRGQYATMNEGLNAAKGEYICFISADDYMAENAVSHAMDWLDSHPGFNGVYGLTSYVTENDSPYPVKTPFLRAPIKYYPYFVQLQHCSLYVSRQTLLQKNLMFDAGIRFVGDYDWVLRMLKAGIRIGFIDSILSTVRIHKNQTTAQNRAMMSKEKREIIQRNGYSGFRYMFFFTIYQGLNLMEQLRFAYKNKRFTGVKDALHEWIFNRTIPYLRNKP